MNKGQQICQRGGEQHVWPLTIDQVWITLKSIKKGQVRDDHHGSPQLEIESCWYKYVLEVPIESNSLNL